MNRLTLRLLCLTFVLAAIGICGCPTGSDEGEPETEREAEVATEPHGEEEPSPPAGEGEAEPPEEGQPTAEGEPEGETEAPVDEGEAEVPVNEGEAETVAFTAQQSAVLRELSAELDPAMPSDDGATTPQDVVDDVIRQLLARSDVAAAAQIGDLCVQVTFDSGLVGVLGGGFLPAEGPEVKNQQLPNGATLAEVVLKNTKAGDTPRAVLMLALQSSSDDDYHFAYEEVVAQMENAGVSTYVYLNEEVKLLNLEVELSDPPDLLMIYSHGNSNSIMLREAFPQDGVDANDIEEFFCGLPASTEGIDSPPPPGWLHVTAHYLDRFDLSETILFLNGCETMSPAANYHYEHGTLAGAPEYLGAFCVVLRNQCAALMGWNVSMAATWSCAFSSDYLFNLAGGDTCAEAFGNMPPYYSQEFEYLTQDYSLTNTISADNFALFPDDSDARLVYTAEAPGGVGASDGLFSDRIRVSWNDVGGAEGYRIYASTTSTGTYTEVGDVGAGVTTYHHMIGPDQARWYKVKAYNSAGESVYSDADQGWTDSVGATHEGETEGEAEAPVDEGETDDEAESAVDEGELGEGAPNTEGETDGETDLGIAWASYLGGSDYEIGYAVAVDAAGSVFATGSTMSSGWVSGGYDTIHGYYHMVDAFVVKLASSGMHSWSSYLGGNMSDSGYGIAVDGSGNVVVTGFTSSSYWVSDGWDTIFDGGDAFVVKLTSSGEHAWSSYLGGNDNESGYGIAVDQNGNILVTGRTESASWVSGGWDTTYDGGGDYGYDAFVVRLTSSGLHAWSSYLGGDGYDRGSGITADGGENVLVTGYTDSSGWVSGGWDTTLGGNDTYSGDGFVVKLGPSGAHAWSSYLGGDGYDGGSGITADGGGNVLVTGSTDASGWVSGGWDTTYNGDRDGFLVKLTSSGAHAWSSYVGGSSYEDGCGVALDGSGNVLVTGSTRSSGWVSGSWDTTLDGGHDAFVVQLTSAGAHAWSSYLGGAAGDEGSGIAVDGAGNVLVIGNTSSSGWVSGGWDTTLGGDSDAFVAKIVWP